MGEPSGLEAYSGTIFLWGFGLLLLGLFILSWPRRRFRAFRFKRLIAAPREAIWRLHCVADGDPQAVAFHDGVVSTALSADDPAICEIVVDASGGHGTHLMTHEVETLERRYPELFVDRIRLFDGKASPFGPDQAEVLELEEHPDGTLATMSWRGELESLWGYLNMRQHYSGYLDRLKRSAETGEIVAGSRLRRSMWKSLAISAVAVGSFALWLGWTGALLLVFVLVVHEFGHLLAMRITGQPAPRMMLIPFFGGIAVANHPHKSLFDDAFCALMGAGFSALLCLLLLLGAHLIGSPTSLLDFERTGQGMNVAGAISVVAVALAAVIGMLNALQLLPVLPLDGGHVLRAVIQSFHAPSARWLLMAVTGLGAVASLWFGLYILAAVLGLGTLQAWYMEPESPKAKPMSAGGLFLIAVGYAATLAIHVGGVLYGTGAMGFTLF